MASTPQSEELKRLIAEFKKLQKEAENTAGITAQENALAAVNAKLKEAQEYYKKNKTEIDSSNEKLDETLKNLEKQNTTLQSIATVNKTIAQSIGDMNKETINFVRSTDQWFKKSQEIATQYLQVSKNIGLSSQSTKVLAKSFNNAVQESMRLGISLEQMQDIYKDFAFETGRSRILSDEEAENIAKITAGLGKSVSEVTEMAEKFDLMGVSSQMMVDIINETIGSSRSLGLNANKVVDTLQRNMKTMQTYSFRGGVRGMTEMAKQAVKMRLDVSDVLNMADKFYKPEAAIEAAANLQMLGGEVAAAFGDPIQLMYEARNAPEELTKRIGQMTSQMIQFNEQTGEFDMTAEARDQINVISEQLGMSKESLIEMSRQSAKISKIKMDVSGNILDEDIREGIAGMARMQDGKWVVDFADTKGNVITSSINDLTKEQAKLVLQQEKEFADKTEKDFLREIAINTQTFEQTVENLTKSTQYGFAGEMDIYGVLMEQGGVLKETMDVMESEMKSVFNNLNAAITGSGGIGEVLRESFGGVGKENIFAKEIRLYLGELNTILLEQINSGKLDMKEVSMEADVVNIATKIGKADDLKIDTGNKTHVLGPAGSFQLNDLDEYYGKDGKFVAGTNLGMDQRVTNMSIQEINRKNSISIDPIIINGNITLTNPDGSVTNMDMSMIQLAVQKMVGDQLMSMRNSVNGGIAGSSLNS